MRLLVTADLHYNHARSKPLADDLIARMNSAGGDAVLVVGDTAVAEGDAFERCLERFTHPGPKLIVAGNHELWTRGDSSLDDFTAGLPARAAALGWHWLEDAPFVAGDVAVVGSVGWYDYGFANPELGIPRRFYEAKISPGAAGHLPSFSHLLTPADDIPPHAREVVARWNDGKFVKLHMTDPEFLDQRLAALERSLQQVRTAKTVVAAIHHLPFAELLPPHHSNQWDFAKAYLGSPRIGQLLTRYPNVRHAVCGHSHFPAKATIGSIHAVNIGSGYRAKTFLALDL